MEMAQENKLGTAPVGKLLLGLAAPAITAQIVNMLYNIVDRIYIGHIPGVGPAALTGVGVAFPVIILITAFSALIGMGGAPQAAIKMGQGDNEGAEKILGSCTTLCLLLSILLTAGFFAFASPILSVFGASPDTLPFALDYLRIYLFGTVFVMLSLGLNSFITTQGFAKVSMLTVVIGAAINIVLDPILIYEFNLGVKGAALATVFSQLVSAVWVLRFLTGKKTVLHIKKRFLRPSLKILLPVLALGVSPFIMQSTESLLSVCLNTSLRKYGGDTAVGAMIILTSLMQVLMMPLMGLAQGAQPIISYNYGAGNRERVKKAFKLLFCSSLIFTTAFWAFNMAFPRVLTALFTNDASLMDMTAWALHIYLAAGFIMGAQIACQQTFVAVGQAKISLFLALLRKIILLIPLIYILPVLLTENKVFSVLLAEPVADVLATCATCAIFAYQFKRIWKERSPSA